MALLGKKKKKVIEKNEDLEGSFPLENGMLRPELSTQRHQPSCFLPSVSLWLLVNWSPERWFPKWCALDSLGGLVKTQMMPAPAHFRFTWPEVGRGFALRTGDVCSLKPMLSVWGLLFEILALEKEEET